MDDDSIILINYLEKKSKLSKSILKKVLNNGGVWLKKFKSSKLSRVRRATTELNKDSYIEFFYDPDFLDMEIPEAKILLDNKDWGLWYKPQGLLSQGNEFGDHCTIIRSVEKIKGPKKAYLVHRLDREAHGLMLLAYNEKSARIFSTKWQKGQVKKFYKVIVLGDISKKYPENKGEIVLNLDNKECRTSFEVISIEGGNSTLMVQIHTGRLHQIRRHFEMIGFPVIGDPRYGNGNKNKDGMKLMSYRLQFKDPFTDTQINFALDEYKI
jgi:tRNA pseudouridine32 synthase/23S rRNA pseudouridine746 synthase